MKKVQQILLVFGLMMYLATPAFASRGSDGGTLTSVEEYKPLESQANAQKFLRHVFENIQEGTLKRGYPS